MVRRCGAGPEGRTEVRDRRVVTDAKEERPRLMVRVIGELVAGPKHVELVAP